jgi:cell division septation protein DedD
MEREAEIKKSVNKAIEKHQGKKGQGKTGNKEPFAKNSASKTNWLKWVATLGPVVALLIVGSYYYTQERETFNNVSGFVLDVFGSNKNTNGDNSETNSDASASLSFEKAERLNKDFGPEDDILSEQEIDLPAENASEKTSEVEMIESTSFENEVEKAEELSVFDNNKVTRNAVETRVPNPDKGADAVVDKNLTYDYNDFNEKPLYNVKKRPDSVPFENNLEEDVPYNDYSRSPNETSTYRAVSATKKENIKNNKITTQQTKSTEKAIPKKSSSRSSAISASPAGFGDFQIIVGAFSDINNAQRYTSQLQSRGYDAYISKGSGLNRVAIGSYSNAEVARPSLTKIKRELNAGAWINAL